MIWIFLNHEIVGSLNLVYNFVNCLDLTLNCKFELICPISCPNVHGEIPRTKAWTMVRFTYFKYRKIGWSLNPCETFGFYLSLQSGEVMHALIHPLYDYPWLSLRSTCSCPLFNRLSSTWAFGVGENFYKVQLRGNSKIRSAIKRDMEGVWQILTLADKGGRFVDWLTKLTRWEEGSWANAFTPIFGWNIL